MYSDIAVVVSNGAYGPCAKCGQLTVLAHIMYSGCFCWTMRKLRQNAWVERFFHPGLCKNCEPCMSDVSTVVLTIRLQRFFHPF